VEKILCFQHGNQSSFSPKLFRSNFALLCDSSQDIVSIQKIRNQKFSAIFEKSKVNFLLEIILFLWTTGF